MTAWIGDQEKGKIKIWCQNFEAEKLRIKNKSKSNWEEPYFRGR